MDGGGKRRRIDTGDANDVRDLLDIYADQLSFWVIFFSHTATTRRLISWTYIVQNLRLVSYWRCKTASATLKRLVLLFQRNRFHAP
jgi:hypothetical protein